MRTPSDASRACSSRGRSGRGERSMVRISARRAAVMRPPLRRSAASARVENRIGGALWHRCNHVASSAEHACQDPHSAREGLGLRQQREHEVRARREVEEVSRVHQHAGVQQRERPALPRCASAGRRALRSTRLRREARPRARRARARRPARRGFRAAGPATARWKMPRREQLRRRELYRRADGEIGIRDQLEPGERLSRRRARRRRARPA